MLQLQESDKIKPSFFLKIQIGDMRGVVSSVEQDAFNVCFVQISMLFGKKTKTVKICLTHYSACHRPVQGAWCSNLRAVNLQTNDHNASFAWSSTVFLKCMKFVIGFVINSSFILGKTRYDHKQKSKYNVQRVYLRPAYYKLWGRCRGIYENVIYVDKSQASWEAGILKLSSIRGDAFCAGLRKYAFS